MDPYRVAVAIATKDRRDILEQTLPLIALQSRPPDIIYIAACSIDDFPRQNQTPSVPIYKLVAPAGLAVQRNAILDLKPDADIILFLDDDFVMHKSYIGNLCDVFQNNSEIVSTSGLVIADGVHGPGIAIDAAISLISEFRMPESQEIRRQVNSYGCNMGFRTSTIKAHGLRFDENLPLYSWLEDVDFGTRIGEFGEVVFAPSLVGVHLGTKVGRTSGRRLGYSQIANPLYLRRKKTIAFKNAYDQILRNILSNVVRSLSPEPWCDRRGRLAGNIEAGIDILRNGRADPKKILRMDPP